MYRQRLKIVFWHYTKSELHNGGRRAAISINLFLDPTCWELPLALGNPASEVQMTVTQVNSNCLASRKLDHQDYKLAIPIYWLIFLRQEMLWESCFIADRKILSPFFCPSIQANQMSSSCSEGKGCSPAKLHTNNRIPGLPTSEVSAFFVQWAFIDIPAIISGQISQNANNVSPDGNPLFSGVVEELSRNNTPDSLRQSACFS